MICDFFIYCQRGLLNGIFCRFILLNQDLILMAMVGQNFMNENFTASVLFFVI